MYIAPTDLERDAYRKVIDGRPVDLYTIRNANGLVARLTNHGARLPRAFGTDVRIAW